MNAARDRFPAPGGPSDQPLRPTSAGAPGGLLGLCAELARLLDDSTCLVGVGNRLRQDDAAGVWLAERFVEAGLSAPRDTILAEDVPESYAVLVADGPWRRVLVTDAVAADAPAGSIVIGPATELLSAWRSTSTHNASLHLCCRLWNEAGKEVWLLGIVPQSVEFGGTTTGVVRDAVETLTASLAAYRERRRTRHVG